MFIRSLSCVATMMALSSFLLAGCGGGGSSSSYSPVTTSASDSNSSVEAASSRAFSPNYTAAIHSDGVWASRTINVYVPSDSDYPVVQAAMHRWEESTDDYFKFNRVATPEEAQVTFQRVPADSLGAGILGKTKYTFNTGSKLLTSADVRITQNGDEKQQSVVAIHEMGHALGIHGHSDGTVDAMYYSVTSQTAITERDLNTIFWLYSTTRSAGHLTSGETETRTIDCTR